MDALSKLLVSRTHKVNGYMDNLYGDYLVTRAEITNPTDPEYRKMELYVVKLLGPHDHCLNFQLTLKNMYGGVNLDQQEQFDCISPHLQPGQVLRIEFAFQFHRDSLSLCMVGFLKRKSKLMPYVLPDVDTDKIPLKPGVCLHPSVKYSVFPMEHEGKWVYPPHGLIALGGESVIPLDLSLGWPKFHPHSETGESEFVLRWQKRVTEKLTGIRTVLAKLF